MKLSTPVSFPEITPKVGYDDRMVFMGSCFSENIGGWLSDLRFMASANPTGISYNPMSLARHIQMALGSDGLSEDLIQEHSGQFVHPDFHSRFNHPDRQGYISAANQALSELKSALLSANSLFLTFGTAIAFEHKTTRRVVNNCHKLPSENFTQRFLEEAEMKDALLEVLDLVQTANPAIRIFFTVSPIRHLRHGAMGNQRSKARLVRLCEMLCDARASCTYLPVYEYVMDELRDYRFYRHDDMVHLSDLGLEMVREKVREHILSADAQTLLKRVEKWRSMMNHRLIHGDSQGAKTFIEKLKKETAALEMRLPGRFQA